MKTKYYYKNSDDFIENLNFEYFETYSLMRGKKYKSEMELLDSEYERLKRKKKLDILEKERFIELEKLVQYTQLLIDKKGQIHFSAKKTNTFYKNDIESKRLIKILKTKIINKSDWMCAPFYRDAILFFDKNDNLITPLNICLSCSYMATTFFNNQINADDITYELLKSFFIDIGHKVEDE